MKVYEVRVTEQIMRSATVYVVADDYDDAEDIARTKYWDGEYDSDLEEDGDTISIEVEAEETDEDPECYE